MLTEKKIGMNRWVFGTWGVLVLLLLLAQTNCNGQQGNQNAVKRVFNAASGTQNSSYLPNSGFSQHFIRGTVTESGGTCNDVVYITLQGSSDGSSFFAIAPTLQLVYATTTARVANSSGTGVYPFTRLAVTSPNAACKYTVWYTGSVLPAASPQSTVNSDGNYLIYTGTLNLAAPGDATFEVYPPTVTSGRYVVYGYTFVSNHATNSALVYFFSDNADACASVTKTGPYLKVFPNLNTIISPPSLVPAFIGAPGKALCANINNSTGATSALYSVVFRVE